MEQQLNNFSYVKLLSIDEIAEPYKAVHSLIREYDLTYLRQTVSDWMASVYKAGSWIEEMSGNFLYFYENLLKIIESAWIIQKIDNSTRLANLTISYNIDEIELMDTKFYCKPADKIYSWDYFPRSLSRKEYINPYKALTKFFKFYSLPKWKNQLENILYISIRDNSTLSGGSINILNVKKHLNKLIDACHLIVVREFESFNTQLKYYNYL